jgi:hypothetical protein
VGVWAQGVRGQLLVLLLLLPAACVGFTPPRAHEEIGFKNRTVTRSQDGLSISAVALGPAEAEAAFGLPLIDRDIQPVWLRVANAGDAPLTLLPLFFDALYFTPAEAAFINHGWFSGDTNEEIELFRWTEEPATERARDQRSPSAFLTD